MIAEEGMYNCSSNHSIQSIKKDHELMGPANVNCILVRFKTKQYTGKDKLIVYCLAGFG